MNSSSPAAHPLRSGRCPAILTPHEAADGLLVRIHTPRGRFPAARLHAIATIAERFGSGIVEISGRGNLQIRGIEPSRLTALTTALAAIEVQDRRPDGPQRLVLTGPVTGQAAGDCIDLDAAADALEELADTIAGLPEKLCIALDGGGLFGLDSLSAALRLHVLDPRTLALGMATPHGVDWIGGVPLDGLVPTIGAVLTRIAASNRRVAAMSAGERRALLPTPLAALEMPPAPRASPPPGRIDLVNGRAAMLAIAPSGRCEAPVLAALCALATEHGDGIVRIAPGRGICIVGNAEKLLDGFTDADLIVSATDPRLRVTSCSGAPSCTRAAGNTLDIAAAIAANWPDGASGSVHVSGCPKGCAHPAAAPLTLVAQGGGLFDVIVNGRAGSTPIGRMPALDAVRRHLAPRIACPS